MNIAPRYWAGATLLLVLASGAFSTTSTPSVPVTDDVVELPKMVVTDTKPLPPPEHWSYARIDTLEVISKASSANTRRFLRDFLMLQDAISVVWPGITQSQRRAPMQLVLCATDNEFSHLVPKGLEENAEFQSALFLQDKDLVTIVVSLIPTEFSSGTEQYVSDPYKAFYSEYFRFLLRKGMGTQAPAWFESGLVQILSTINFDKKSVELGRLDNSMQDSGVLDTDSLTNTADSDTSSPQNKQVMGGFAGYLRKHALLDFDHFIVQKPAPGEDTIGWQAQSFGFVHLCLYGRGKRYQKGLLSFVEQTIKAKPTPELFKHCFGKSYDDMMVELRGYISISDHEYIEARAKKGQSLPEPAPIEIRDASDAEGARIKGVALRQGGHIQESNGILLAAYLRGEHDPELLAALGLSELSIGQSAKGRQFLEAAYRAKCTNGPALLRLSRLRYEERKTSGQPLDRGALDFLLAPLLIAAEAERPNLECFELLVQAWTESNCKPTKQQLVPLVKGMNLYPQHGAYLYNCARLYASANLNKEARAIIEMGLGLARTPEAQRLFKQLKESLPKDS